MHRSAPVVCMSVGYLTDGNSYDVAFPHSSAASRFTAGAFGILNLSQSFGGRLTAIAMVMMVIGYLVWPLVQCPALVHTPLLSRSQRLHQKAKPRRGRDGVLPCIDAL